MSLTWIKICGICDQAALDAAVEAGAAAVGFVMADSPRRVSATRAAELIRQLPRNISSVVVTLAPVPGEFDELFSLVVPSYFQADADALEGFDLPAGCEALPVYRNSAPETCPERLVYEGAKSGVGKTADWALARKLAQRTRLVLAGGLHQGNVAGAVAAVRPFGVDVSSGVESSPGVKDPQKIREFVAAVRAAECEME
jgi:phosphoribosylanthranilate isomerase